MQADSVSAEPQRSPELKGEIEKSMIKVRNCKTSFYESSRQKINKDMDGLKGTINQLDLSDIYSIIHPTTE